MAGVTELTFLKWVSRINEKLTFLLLSVREHKDITEQDYALLETLHRDWFLGEFPIYAHENAFIKKDETAVEQTLFDDKRAESANGMKVDSPMETKTKNK